MVKVQGLSSSAAVSAIEDTIDQLVENAAVEFKEIIVSDWPIKTGRSRRWTVNRLSKKRWVASNPMDYTPYIRRSGGQPTILESELPPKALAAMERALELYSNRIDAAISDALGSSNGV